MKIYNTDGELVVEIKMDAQTVRGDQSTLIVLDKETNSLLGQVLQNMLTELKKITLHLASASEENISEKDVEG